MGISTLRRHHEARAASQQPAAPPAVVPYDQARQMVRDAVRPLHDRIAELQAGGDLGAAQARIAELEAKLAELESKSAAEPSEDEVPPAVEPIEPIAGDPAAEQARGKRGRR